MEVHEKRKLLGLYGISGGKLNYFPLVNIHHLS